jgi:hypothetical protein
MFQMLMKWEQLVWKKKLKNHKKKWNTCDFEGAMSSIEGFVQIICTKCECVDVLWDQMKCIGNGKQNMTFIAWNLEEFSKVMRLDNCIEWLPFRLLISQIWTYIWRHLMV